MRFHRSLLTLFADCLHSVIQIRSPMEGSLPIVICREALAGKAHNFGETINCEFGERLYPVVFDCVNRIETIIVDPNEQPDPPTRLTTEAANFYSQLERYRQPGRMLVSTAIAVPGIPAESVRLKEYGMIVRGTFIPIPRSAYITCIFEMLFGYTQEPRDATWLAAVEALKSARESLIQQRDRLAGR